MDFDPVVVGIVDGTLQLTVGEVTGEGPRTEVLACEIDGIASPFDGGRESVGVPCWRQYFHAFPMVPRL